MLIYICDSTFAFNPVELRIQYARIVIYSLKFLFFFCINCLCLPSWRGTDANYYANTPMQYTAIFHDCTNVHFQMKSFNIFLIFVQNFDCGYEAVLTEAVLTSSHNLCTCFAAKIRKNIPLSTPILLYKSGV